MKPLFAALFCLFTLTAHAQAWPRNPTTGKVEFKGMLPWPASAKTEAQRRALVRRWYLAKLTRSTPTEVEAQAATNQTNGLLTYAGLPKVAGLRNGSGDEAQLLDYFVKLTPSARGVQYDLATLSLQRSGDVETGEATPLERVLASPTLAQQTALVALRKRLATALASW